MDDQNKPRRPGGAYPPPSAKETQNEDAGMTKRVETIRPAAARRSSTDSSGRRKPTPQKTSTGIAVFYIVTLLVGIIVCVAVFALVFNAIRNESQKTPGTVTASPLPSAIIVSPSASGTQTEAPISNEGTATTAVSILLAVNPANNTISLYDATNSMPRAFEVDITVPLKDKYGSNIVLGYLTAGDIVDITLEENTDKLLAIQISTQAWTHLNLSNAVVDTAARTVTIANQQYTYDSHLLALHKTETFDIAKLDPMHVITIRGYDTKLLSLEVAQSFGEVAIKPNADILNGKIDIGLDTYALADIHAPIKAREGVHRVVVTGSNIERYETEATIRPDETAEIDLKNVKFKGGMLTIHINEPYAVVRLNGALVDSTVPLSMAHGEYTLRVEKEGFTPYESTFSFQEPAKEISVTLQKTVQLKDFHVYTIPEGADVYVDTAYYGTSPASVQESYGQHTLIVRMEGYVTVSIPINVSEDMLNPEITLQPSPEATMP